MKENTDKMLRRVEQHRLKPSSPFFSMFHHFCHLSKNLYNHGNYIIRQEFIKNGKWIRYGELDRILKKDTEYPDYKAMPSARTAQQTLRLLDKNWKAFFVSIKDWKKHPEKYNGKPNLPNYKRKNGSFVLIVPSQRCKIKNSQIYLPKAFKGFTIKPNFIENKKATFRQIRFIPCGRDITIEIVYVIPDVRVKEDNGRYAAIDIGVDNLAAFVMNTGNNPIIIKGTPIKSINQYYNKELAKRASICKLMNNTYSSKRIARLTKKRTRRINDYLHKASRKIIDECEKNDITVLIIGRNKNWKQKTNLSNKVKQSFVQLPFARFIKMIQYKAKERGIDVRLTEENYTSGTSFLDNEMPTKTFYNKKRRIHRGLFITNDGRKINADVNGAFQIMKKVFPNISANGIESTILHPIVVALSKKVLASNVF